MTKGRCGDDIIVTATPLPLSEIVPALRRTVELIRSD